MRNIVKYLLFVLFVSVIAVGATDFVESPEKCVKCGMSRSMFAHSRMLVAYADGVTTGVCSLHCAAETLLHTRDKQVSSLKVADYSTKKLVDASSAVWVVGGKKKGVMTATAKWAFATTDDARRFIEESGGTLKTFNQTLDAAIREVKAQATEEMTMKSKMSH